MPTTMSIAEAREKLTSLPNSLNRGTDDEVVVVTRHNKPVLAILPWELYESIIETMEILSDSDLMAELRQSMSEAARGEAIRWEDAKRMLESHQPGE